MCFEPARRPQTDPQNYCYCSRSSLKMTVGFPELSMLNKLRGNRMLLFDGYWVTGAWQHLERAGPWYSLTHSCYWNISLLKARSHINEPKIQVTDFWVHEQMDHLSLATRNRKQQLLAWTRLESASGHLQCPPFSLLGWFFSHQITWNDSESSRLYHARAEPTQSMFSCKIQTSFSLLLLHLGHLFFPCHTTTHLWSWRMVQKQPMTRHGGRGVVCYPKSTFPPCWIQATKGWCCKL